VNHTNHVTFLQQKIAGIALFSFGQGSGSVRS
jgi:hypothetical protein